MLPSNLLVARRRGNTVKPVYAQLSQENVELAELLIQTYKDYVGRRKGELNEVVEGLEGLGRDYRFVRGLAVLLDRRCRLEARAPVNPLDVRVAVFELSGREIPTTAEMRALTLARVASKLGVTVEDLEESLYGDLEDELTLKEFNPVEPTRLLRQYNLSLTQTMLFNSTELEFTASGNWQRIFRQIKRLGLIYTVWRENSGYRVKVDGPLSLFKLNRRYGVCLAKLLPTVIQNEKWHVKANILHRGERRLLNMEISSDTHGGLMETFEPTEEAYDSLVEKDFAEAFEALGTGWRLTREPDPIPVGRQVIIPDFSFQRFEAKVYMEIVGFWTPQYLKEKLEKLRMLRGLDVIVAVDRKLACQEVDKLTGKLDVIYYEHKVPLQPILAHLKKREAEMLNAHVKRLKEGEFTLSEPVETVDGIASRLGVLKEAVRSVIAETSVPGYRRLGDILVRDSKLREIEGALDQGAAAGGMSLEEATRLIKGLGVEDPMPVLKALGYSIKWRGISPQDAVVVK